MNSQAPIRRKNELCESDIWSAHEPAVWEAERFVGRPFFYPVYQWKSFFSYSFLALLRLKGTLHLNREVAQYVEAPDFLCLPPGIQIDSDIVRIGGPVETQSRRFRRPADFVAAMAGAVKEDVAAIESKNPECENLVLVGGKDSLNLLLLPWRHPVTAASAAPNFSLVRRFVEENRLGIPVVELSNTEDSALPREACINCCRIPLQHARWGGQLRAWCEARDRRVVIWKGQLGDVVMSAKWRSYLLTSKYDTFRDRRLVNVASRLLPVVFGGILQRRFWRVAWSRGAAWQGIHTAVIRENTQCLTVSAYHGPRVASVLRHSFLPTAVVGDLRPAVGHQILGRRVSYPMQNPGPEPWNHRIAANSVQYWCDQLRTLTDIRL